MDVSRHGSVFCSRTVDPKYRAPWFAVVVAVVLVAATLARPVAAVDCGECDSGCHLQTDAFGLLESYVEDKAAFSERSRRCGDTDERWSEIMENIEELDQPPPPQQGRFRDISKLELAMINHKLGIRYCMQFCGREEYRENCVGGPGGMSCDCKPAALAYCRSESNQSMADTIAPGFSSTGASGTSEAGAGAARPEVEEAAVPEQRPESVDEPRYLIEVEVSGDGFAPDRVFVPCDFEPSSVAVSGRVTDDAGLPVPNARVSLAGLGAVMTTDARGQYSLSVLTQGDRPMVAVRNFVVIRPVKNLAASVTPTSPVWANGRDYEAVLSVSADGVPLAGRDVTLTGWKGYTHQGEPIAYVIESRSNHISLHLDDGGKARFRFSAPIVPRAMGAALRDPDSRFPVDGSFRLMVRGQTAETECSYRIESPFPKIGRIRVPGNVDAGLWQVRPSSIRIEDPDSSSFRVTVRGLGDFRTTTPGAATKAGVLTHELAGKEFDFLYRPPKGAFDPAKLPDELDQFMNTSKNIYISVVTNVVGGMLVDKVQVAFPSDALGAYLVKKGMLIDANKLLDAGGNMANVVNLGTATYNDMSEIQADPDNPEKKVIAAGNYLIGVVDTAMGFAGTLGSVKAKLYWEGAKAYWEYVKLMNSLTNQYEEIGNAYQGTSFYPIEVTVEDESGHRSTASRACSVRVWKGGTQ